MTYPTPPLPPGPADTIYTRKSLAKMLFLDRLADCFEYAAELAEPVGYRTPFFESGCFEQEEILPDTQRLVEYATAVHEAMAIFAYEQKVPGEPYGHDSSSDADTQHDAVIREWNNCIGRPWRHNEDSPGGSCDYASALPAALADPRHTRRRLNEWYSRVNPYYDPEEQGEFGDILTPHTIKSEIRSVQNHADFLACQPDATSIEQAAHAQRARRVAAAKQAHDAELPLLKRSEIPEGTEELDHLLRSIWIEVVKRLEHINPELHKLLHDQTPALHRGRNNRARLPGHPDR